MSNFYAFTIPSRPPAKSNMYGVRVVGKRGIIYTTRELEDYEMMVGNIVKQVIPKTLMGYHAIYLRIHQKGKRFIDVDNVFKAIQDSIDTTKTIKRGKNEIRICESGIENDKYFQLIVGERVIHNNKSEEQERVEVVIAPYKGLFDFVDTVKGALGLSTEYYNDLYLPYE